MNERIKLRGEGPIVLVDDDDADGWLLRRCYEMSMLSNELIWLPSGLALNEHLAAVIGGRVGVPALIMLDLRTAGVNGVQTSRLLDAIPRHVAPDILVFTNSRTPHYLDKACRLGATAWLAKADDPADTIEYFNSLAA